jgi:hypothetical protein
MISRVHRHRERFGKAASKRGAGARLKISEEHNRQLREENQKLKELAEEKDA